MTTQWQTACWHDIQVCNVLNILYKLTKGSKHITSTVLFTIASECAYDILIRWHLLTFGVAGSKSSAQIQQFNEINLSCNLQSVVPREFVVNNLRARRHDHRGLISCVVCFLWLTSNENVRYWWDHLVCLFTSRGENEITFYPSCREINLFVQSWQSGTTNRVGLCT